MSPALRMNLLNLPGCWQHQHPPQMYPPCLARRMPFCPNLGSTAPLSLELSHGSQKRSCMCSPLARTFLVTRSCPPSHKEKFHAHLSQVRRPNSAKFMMFPCVLRPTVNTKEFLLHCFKGCFLSVWNMVWLCFHYIQRTFNLLLPSQVILVTAVLR